MIIKNALKPLIFIVGFAFIMLMSACSRLHIPDEIRQAPDDGPSITQVHRQADAYISQKIRWGGVILQTENKHEASWLTIIAYPLDDDGRPQESDLSLGRFIAIANEFIEPLVYSRNREITVTGTLIRIENHKVGEFLYEYPVIQIDHYYLWPAKLEPTAIDNRPYWGYDPYYPWHPPYYYPHRHFW